MFDRAGLRVALAEARLLASPKGVPPEVAVLVFTARLREHPAVLVGRIQQRESRIVAEYPLDRRGDVERARGHLHGLAQPVRKPHEEGDASDLVVEVARVFVVAVFAERVPVVGGDDHDRLLEQVAVA